MIALFDIYSYSSIISSIGLLVVAFTELFFSGGRHRYIRTFVALMGALVILGIGKWEASSLQGAALESATNAERLKHELAIVQESISETVASRAALEMQIESMQSSLDHAEQQSANLKSRLVTVQGTLDQAGEQNTSLRSDLARIQGSLDLAEGLNTNLRSQLTEVQIALDRAEIQNAELHNKVTTVQDTIARLEQENASLKDEIVAARQEQTESFQDIKRTARNASQAAAARAEADNFQRICDRNPGLLTGFELPKGYCCNGVWQLESCRF